MRLTHKTSIWLKLTSIALLLAGAAFGFSTAFQGQLGSIVLYLFAPLVVLLVIFFAAVVVRLRVVGKLPSDIEQLFSEVDSRLSPTVLNSTRYWAIFRLCILGAVVLLIVASIISIIAGTGIQRGVEGFVYLTLLMMVGNLIVGTVVNLNLVKQTRSRNYHETN